MADNSSDVFVFDEMVGRSSAMKDVIEKLKKVAQYDVTVLLHGESGTGKELAARAIHFNSPRKDNEFVIINCSAFSDYLLESELFGHMKGSFTGAVAEKEGLFEVANNGTFFLDEIADMSPALQVKLLRVLQEGTFLKIGGTKPITVDVRIICATNKDLEKLVKERKFREDLFYRINVMPVYMPPLNERREDIEVLANHILENISKKNREEKKELDSEALQILVNYNWPGNVRQMENVLERCAILTKKKIIDAECLKQTLPFKKETPEKIGINGKTSLKDIKKRIVADVEKKAILEGLEKTGWNKTKCAKLLKVSRGDLMRKISKYKLKKLKE